jgi:hypothetical protein
MFFDLTWLDLVLAVLLAGVVVLGARRGLIGLVTGLISLLLWLVVNVFGGFHPLLGFVLALLFGAGVAWVGRNLLNELVQNLSDIANHAAGGVGGLILGLCLIFTLVLSFPTSLNTEKAPVYPSVSLPIWLGEAVSGSSIQKWLRNPPSKGGIGVWSGDADMLKNLFTPDFGKR